MAARPRLPALRRSPSLLGPTGNVGLVHLLLILLRRPGCCTQRLLLFLHGYALEELHLLLLCRHPSLQRLRLLHVVRLCLRHPRLRPQRSDQVRVRAALC